MGNTLTVPLPRDSARTRLERLYRESRDDVYAYVATLLGDRASAEDVTAQAFERAYRKRASFNPRRGSERGWLFGIARNAALDELRRRKRRGSLVTDPVDDQPALEERGELALRRAVLRRALATLEPRDVELIALKFHAGLSNGELATTLGISASNAGTRLHRALSRLREACNETQ